MLWRFHGMSGKVTLDFVRVGDAGNRPDPVTGAGAVGYEFLISRYEVTVGQYTVFLNAVAQADPHGLYHTAMASDANVAGIVRGGSPGAFKYTVMPGCGNHPVTYVSWFDAARFCNWLHHGQGEGDTETGAYSLKGKNQGMDITVEAGARAWIPTWDEWHKAAFYDPTKGGGGGYWSYAIRSDALRDNTASANYFDGDYAVTQSSSYSTGQNYLTDVGAYGSVSASYYGTCDQAGNVAEWNDGVLQGKWRAQRGGGWLDTGMLVAWAFNRADPAAEGRLVGFRVAAAPERAAAGLAVNVRTADSAGGTGR